MCPKLNLSINLNTASAPSLTCLRRLDYLRVRQVEHVDPVYGEDDVAHPEAGGLRRGVRLDGGDDDGAGPVDAEAELAADAGDAHAHVAL